MSSRIIGSYTQEQLDNEESSKIYGYKRVVKPYYDEYSGQVLCRQETIYTNEGDRQIWLIEGICTKCGIRSTDEEYNNYSNCKHEQSLISRSIPFRD